MSAIVDIHFPEEMLLHTEIYKEKEIVSWVIDYCNALQEPPSAMSVCGLGLLSNLLSRSHTLNKDDYQNMGAAYANVVEKFNLDIHNPGIGQGLFTLSVHQIGLYSEAHL